MRERSYIPYDQISIGQSATMDAAMDNDSVMRFSELLGDDNSFHVSDESAAMTVFKKRIVHGVHIAAFISALVGQRLPGFGTIYCTQTLDFRKPVYIGATITVTVAVLDKLPGRRLRMSTVITDAEGDTVLQGEAVVKTYA